MSRQASEPANPTEPERRLQLGRPGRVRQRRRFRNHLEPVLTIFQAPNWASGLARCKGNGYDGVNNVNPAKFHDFAVALAKHYNGDVHYYEVWNEPNLPWFFTPQMKNGKFVSPARYRALVNAFATGIHSVDPSATVIAGNTAPFGHPPPAGTASGRSPSSRASPRRKVHFDAWSTHPYTYGGPTHHANKDSDVSLGDMGELRKILNKARQLGEDPRLAQAAALGVRVQLGLPRARQRGVGMKSPVALDLGDRLPPEQGRRERAALVRACATGRSPGSRRSPASGSAARSTFRTTRTDAGT